MIMILNDYYCAKDNAATMPLFIIYANITYNEFRTIRMNRMSWINLSLKKFEAKFSTPKKFTACKVSFSQEGKTSF